MDKGKTITKKCEICGAVKPIEEFSKSYRNRCKKCVAEQARNMRELKKIAKTGAFGFTWNSISIHKQLALETIDASEIILSTYLFYMFKEFPEKEKMVDEILKNYKSRITKWLNDKTKNLLNFYALTKII